MSLINKIPKSFYITNDVITQSKYLLGKTLVSNFNNQKTSGIITEVEAYLGEKDKASHSYNNCRTNRTEPMFKLGGIAYIYLCYGMHHLFNVVVGHKNFAHAILIRSLEPKNGIDIMLKSIYPNPFNPSTTISFEVSKDIKVILEVYDVNGSKIKDLYNKKLEKGSYSIAWDAKKHPSGIYFVKLTAGEYINTKKVMLIK